MKIAFIIFAYTASALCGFGAYKVSLSILSFLPIDKIRLENSFRFFITSFMLGMLFFGLVLFYLVREVDAIHKDEAADWLYEWETRSGEQLRDQRSEQINEYWRRRDREINRRKTIAVVLIFLLIYGVFAVSEFDWVRFPWLW